MESVDVADGVVEVGIVGDGVWTTIGQCKEGIAPGVGNRGTHAAEFIGANSVFEWVGEAGKVLEVACAGFIERAYGKKRNLGLRDRGDEEGEGEQTKHRTTQHCFHESFLLLGCGMASNDPGDAREGQVNRL